MPLTARFQASLAPSNIDAENGVLIGCRIATFGATANTAKENGGGLKMDEEMIAGLARLGTEAGKVDAFLTHDWSKEDAAADPLHLDVGYWDNFRRDEASNLVADFHAAPSPHREGLFWRAKNNPASIAVSPLFTYSLRNGDAALANPERFVSSDFVKWGAINAALFSASKPDTTMPLTTEQKAEVNELIAAFSKANQPAEITQDHPAIVAAVSKNTETLTAKFTADLAKSIGEQKEAILAEAKVAAKAELTAKLGASGFIERQGEGGGAHPFLQKVEAHKATGCNEHVAKMRAAHDSPELYNAYQKQNGIFKTK